LFRFCGFFVFFDGGKDNWEVKESGRKLGEKQPKKVKCTSGVLVFSMLLVLIWFP
jgi:hypothetical protein